MVFAQISLPVSDSLWGFLGLLTVVVSQLILTILSMRQNAQLIHGQHRAREKQEVIHDQIKDIAAQAIQPAVKIDCPEGQVVVDTVKEQTTHTVDRKRKKPKQEV